MKKNLLKLRRRLNKMQTPDTADFKQLTLPQWLERIEACHPAEIELGLDRLQQVASRLELKLDSAFKVVAGGTNGKGSTLAMLDAVLLASGKTTGRFSSPHFLHYNERVLLNGEPAEDAAFCRAFVAIEQARGDIPLTYFEYGTLAALLIMSEAGVDVMLLEVGLGGRLDAVNIVDADLALVSTVALDHTDWLGPDRESIGFEKAGIYRAGKPALCGDPEPPQSLLAHAEQLGAQLYARGQAFDFEAHSDSWHWQGQGATGPVSLTELPNPGLPLANAAMVMQAIQLMPWQVSEHAIRAGLASVQLTGRMQRCQWRGLDLLLDVAHNPEAAEYLSSQLAGSASPVHLVLGMLHDKDIGSVIKALSDVVDHWYPVSLDVPRGTSVQELTDQVLQAGVSASQVHSGDSVAQVLQQLASDEVEGQIVVAGSFFTVADALACITEG